MKYAISLIPMLALVSLNAMASGGSAPKSEPTPTVTTTTTVAPAAPKNKEAFEGAKRALAEIQGLIDAGSYNEARSRSRSLMLEIRERSGIDPKTPQVITVGVEMTNEEMQAGFEQLGASKRFEISRVVKEQKEGYLLDLLNLAKRAHLLYLRASYQQMIALNRLAERDMKYFRNELLQIHAVPLFFKVGKQKEYYLAFDMEVADTAIQYEFNRELLDLALEIKDFGYTEGGFEAELANTIKTKRASHVQSLNALTGGREELSTGHFTKADFKVREIAIVSDRIVQLIEPTYRGLPINEFSVKKLQTGGHTIVVPFASVICRAFDFPNMTILDGGTFTGDYAAKQITIDLELSEYNYGDAYRDNRYGYQSDVSSVTEGFRVMTINCLRN